jgi:beta-glucanase (GH16 family)
MGSNWPWFALLAMLGLASGQVAAQDAPAARGRELFFDDFNGAELDRSKWNAEVSGAVYNNECQAYIDSKDTARVVKGAEAGGTETGALLIQAVARPGFRSTEGKRYDFVSARLNTRGKFQMTRGTAAARMKLPPGAGFWPAFWLLGNGNWPDDGEIDIMEYVGETDWVGVAIHGPGYSGETPLVNKYFFPKRMDATDWHVYSVDWTEEGFVFRVDSVVMYRATKPMIVHYGRWAFDSPKFLIVNLALGGAYPYKTNGVKEPYSGIPASTVDLIKEGKGRILVDWVRVTGE